MMVMILLPFWTTPAMGQDIIVFPAKGQTDEQVAKDKNSCHDLVPRRQALTQHRRNPWLKLLKPKARDILAHDSGARHAELPLAQLLVQWQVE
ncbi:MAG: hypothetical protein ACI8PB_004674 [Desulforhopalus sp.]